MKYSSLKTVLGMVGIATLFAGCATFSGAENKENIQKLKVGMSKNQVLNILGTPDTVVAEKNATDRWLYEFRSDDKKGRNLFVEFGRNGLARTGELNGRDVAAANDNGSSGSCTKWVRPEFVDTSLCTK